MCVRAGRLETAKSAPRHLGRWSYGQKRGSWRLTADLGGLQPGVLGRSSSYSYLQGKVLSFLIQYCFTIRRSRKSGPLGSLLKVIFQVDVWT